MMQKIKNIVQLGFKELRGLMRDPLLLGLILYTFTVGIYVRPPRRRTPSPMRRWRSSTKIIRSFRSALPTLFSRRVFCGRFRFHALKSTRAWTAATTRSYW